MTPPKKGKIAISIPEMHTIYLQERVPHQSHHSEYG